MKIDKDLKKGRRNSYLMTTRFVRFLASEENKCSKGLLFISIRRYLTIIEYHFDIINVKHSVLAKNCFSTSIYTYNNMVLKFDKF